MPDFSRQFITHARRLPIHHFSCGPTTDIIPSALGKEVVITGSAATRMNEFLDAMEMVRLGKVLPVFQSFPLTQVVEASRQMDDRKVFGRTGLVP